MKIQLASLIFLSTLCIVSSQASAQSFDFFYFVQQWPGSYCDTRQSCCYPSTGKPAADFGIHGLWPNYNDGTYPSNCDTRNPYVASKVNLFSTASTFKFPMPMTFGMLAKALCGTAVAVRSPPPQVRDLTSAMQANWPTLACPSGSGQTFWAHEWSKHGTCSESVMNQHGYFQAALNLKQQVNLLQILTSAGIQPNDQSYGLDSISQAIAQATGYTPGIECNTDVSGNSQLYQIYLCVDTSGTSLVECPVLPSGKCYSDVQFPSF